MQSQIRDYSDSQANAETKRRGRGPDCLCTVTSLISVDIILIPCGIKDLNRAQENKKGNAGSAGKSAI